MVALVLVSLSYKALPSQAWVVQHNHPKTVLYVSPVYIPILQYGRLKCHISATGTPSRVEVPKRLLSDTMYDTNIHLPDMKYSVTLVSVTYYMETYRALPLGISPIKPSSKEKQAITLSL
ncbi:1268_t:CDS:2 [Acaulospora morrowiae]|uniref:1268_t:CDS:1 n=1 Tax=Acaulospora morrowiae TaxID=94023 RepID=A0A9N9DV98_9GLOM|nr:1268_t:CDS:2 [Acaulospora morrowiae]